MVIQTLEAVYLNMSPPEGPQFIHLKRKFFPDQTIMTYKNDKILHLWMMRLYIEEQNPQQNSDYYWNISNNNYYRNVAYHTTIANVFGVPHPLNFGRNIFLSPHLLHQMMKDFSHKKIIVEAVNEALRLFGMGYSIYYVSMN